jgi:hypothetical protein
MPQRQEKIKYKNLVLLISESATAGVYDEFNFKDGSISYFDANLKQSFQYTLIDNIGRGIIRICYNRPGYNLTSAVIGTKTLYPLDSLYLDEDIWNIRIYYVEPSTVELVLTAKNEEGGVL